MPSKRCSHLGRELDLSLDLVFLIQEDEQQLSLEIKLFMAWCCALCVVLCCGVSVVLRDLFFEL